MNNDKNSLPRVRGFGALAASFALAKLQSLPATAVPQIAQRSFGQSKQLQNIIQRANEVAAGSTGGWASELTGDDVVSEFLAAVRYREVIGRLSAQDVPPNVKLSGLDGEASAAVVTEGGAIPLSAPSFSTPITVSPLKVASLVAFSNELLRRGKFVDAAVGFALLRAVVHASDAAFLSTASYGVLNGVTPIASGGGTPEDIDFDLAELLASLSGADLESVQLVTTPAVALGLSLLREFTRAYPNVTPRGGDISGIPLLVSAGVPSGYLVAIDGSAVVKGGEQLIIEQSQNATLEMSSAPIGHVVTPAGQTQNPVSLFQAEATAVKVVRTLGWKLKRPNVVGYITGMASLSGIVTT